MIKASAPIGRTYDTSTLVSAKFGPGMLLRHEDLEQLSVYTRDLSRLMFKSFFGCGVVCGLEVTASVNCGAVEVTVDAGVALGCSGDPVFVPSNKTFALDEKGDFAKGISLWVVLCGTVKSCAPRTATCSSDEDEAPSVSTRERAGYEIRVYRDRPECVCGCSDPVKTDTPVTVTEDEGVDCRCVDPKLKCYEGHYSGKCGCNCDECTDCDCKCILLARLERGSDIAKPWIADYRVRRFIRPVLMRDPRVEPKKIVQNQANVLSNAADQPNQVQEQTPNAADEINQLKEQLRIAEEQLEEANDDIVELKEQLRDKPKEKPPEEDQPKPPSAAED